MRFKVNPKPVDKAYNAVSEKRKKIKPGATSAERERERESREI